MSRQLTFPESGAVKGVERMTLLGKCISRRKASLPMMPETAARIENVLGFVFTLILLVVDHEMVKVR